MACDTNTDDSRFEEVERRGYVDKIRAFLTRAVSDGGVLVVCGPRGVGKSRLVDQALNDGPRNGLFRIASVGCSRHRLQVMRKPRQIFRDVVKVDVDPYFPHWSVVQEKGKDADPAAIAPYQVIVNTVQGSDKKKHRAPVESLLNNLLIALTGTLAPQFSLRRYGRTLRERLGFFRYWFSPAALSFNWSSEGRCTDCWGLLWSYLIGLFFFCATFATVCWFGSCRHWSRLPTWAVYGYITFGFIAPVTAWCWLRYLDWRALEKISHKLFDLSHAEQSSQSEAQKTGWDVSFKRNGDMAAGLVVALAGLQQF